MIGIFKKKPKIDAEPEPTGLLGVLLPMIRGQMSEQTSLLREIRALLGEETALNAQVLTKMAKYFEVQAKFTEKQVEMMDTLAPTKDDLKF